jgi:hypothetical protein
MNRFVRRRHAGAAPALLAVAGAFAALPAFAAPYQRTVSHPLDAGIRSV